MSEVEKLMQNANVEKDWKSLPYGDIEEYYPEFTAEKQLSLIKWLAKMGESFELSICWNDISKSFQFIIRNMWNGAINRSVCGLETSFEEVLAYLLNSIWLDLTDTEKAEIKRILE